MQLFFIELEPHRTDIGLLTGGSLLVTANDRNHAEGVADEYILKMALRAKVKVKDVRPVRLPDVHDAKILDHAYVIE